MSADTLRRAASEMREYAARGIAWEPEWDGDRAADKGWLAPPVALAVADWLEQEADDLDSDPDAGTYAEHDLVPCIQRALAVARAFLGEGA